MKSVSDLAIKLRQPKLSWHLTAACEVLKVITGHSWQRRVGNGSNDLQPRITPRRSRVLANLPHYFCCLCLTFQIPDQPHRVWPYDLAIRHHDRIQTNGDALRG